MKQIYILFLVLCLAGCTSHDRTQREQAPIRVKTMVVSSHAGTGTSRYVGTIAPVRETPLSMQTSGRVVSVEVKNGQRVHKGQALVSVDNTQALNSLQGAEATLKHAQDGYDRAHQVHEKGVIADQKMVEIESQLNQAQSLYAAAKQRLEECTLVAPCDGIVDGLEVEKGQTIIPGTKVCTIKDVSAFCVLFTVPEGEVSAFRNTSSAMKGEVECAAVNRVFPITVTETSVTANAVTHTYDVKARIEGGTDVLMIGMVAKVQITNHQSSITNNTIVIPARCVLLKPEGHTVWVMENGQAVRKDIRVDGYQADGVRVSEGLQEGDTLIIDGYQKLYTGCKVVES